MSFRVVRFKISDDSYETLVTNVTEFTPEQLKHIYNMRWGIETSSQYLKHAIGLSTLHSKKVECIAQEIFAKLTVYNFCQSITLSVVVEAKNTKYVYAINICTAITICKKFLNSCHNALDDTIECLITRHLTSIRPGRCAHRKVIPKSSMSFLYRIV